MPYMYVCIYITAIMYVCVCVCYMYICKYAYIPYKCVRICICTNMKFSTQYSHPYTTL